MLSFPFYPLMRIFVRNVITKNYVFVINQTFQRVRVAETGFYVFHRMPCAIDVAKEK